jgi:hypothetical protein
MLVPVMLPGHFILVVVLHDQRVLECYDPLGVARAKSRRPWLASIMAWINERREMSKLGLLPTYEFRYNSTEFPGGLSRDARRGVPRLPLQLSAKTQRDATSCSGYVCAAARCAITTGQPLTEAELTGDPVRELRLFMLETYLNAVDLPASTLASLTPPPKQAPAGGAAVVA